MFLSWIWSFIVHPILRPSNRRNLIVLVSPQGQNTVLMSNVGGEVRNSITNVTLTLDDDAPSFMPLDAPLVSGTFKPTRRLAEFTFTFPSPAPAVPDGASLSLFNGSEPDGTWNLYVIDDAYPDSGIISGGWNMTITTTPVVLSITPVGSNVILSWTNALVGYGLQTAPSLVPAVTWTNALPAPVMVSGQYMVTNPISGLARYYRLSK
jgi:hypothetical protein